MPLFDMKLTPTDYYAVAVGRNVGIYHSWDECKKQVLGYPNAKYKKFDNELGAQSFIDMYTGGEDVTDYSNYYKAYTDGSNVGTTKYAYGFVILDPKENVIQRGCGGYDKGEFLVHRNIAGECFGVLKALDYCKENNITSLLIYHDYIGLKHWAEGSWKTNSAISIYYKNGINYYREYIGFKFVWVKGHNKNKWNEEADKLAKDGLNFTAI